MPVRAGTGRHLFGIDDEAVDAVTLRSVVIYEPQNTTAFAEFAEVAGFGEVHLQLTIDVRPSPPLLSTAMLNVAANPRLPALAEAMCQALTPDEVERLSAHLQPPVERGRGTQRVAVSYLSARRR